VRTAPDLQALRPHVGGALPDDDAPRVLRVDPRPGARGVFRDAAVVFTLSHPLDPTSLGPQAVRVLASDAALAGGLALSPDRSIVVWTPQVPLPAVTEHVLEVIGLRDRYGRAVATHRSGFVAGLHTLDELGRGDSA
jgi:hypothetical protein